MKKKIIMLLFALFMFIPCIKVNALELTQEMFDSVMSAGDGEKIGNITYSSAYGFYLDPDDYTLGEDISVHHITFNGGESTLNLSNKTLSSIIVTEGAKLTIEGDGVVDGGLGVYAGDYDGNIGSEVIIKGGTYDDIDVTYSKLVIENATIEGEYHGITLGTGADVEIKGGTFNVGPEGIALEVGTHYSENAKLTVRGGTFSGGEFGLYAKYEAYDQVSLLGGTFKGSVAAIKITSNDSTTDEELKTSINDLLGAGFTYSPNMTFITESDGGVWKTQTDQKELSVVAGSSDDESGEEFPTTPTGDDTSNTTNNPQTGDNIMFFISMLGLSIIGLAGAGLYTRKKKFN